MNKQFPLAPKPDKPPVPAVHDSFGTQVDDILNRLRGLKKMSFMDMVPEDYRSHVELIADNAYPTKGGERNPEEFLEDMALNWLAKRELFTVMGEQAGLESVNNLDSSADTPFMALTMSASIVLATKPDESSKRDVYYYRIKERQDTSIPTATNTTIGSVSMDESFKWLGNSTSPVIGILANPSAELDIHRTAMDIETGFKTVDRQTRI